MISFALFFLESMKNATIHYSHWDSAAITCKMFILLRFCVIYGPTHFIVQTLNMEMYLVYIRVALISILSTQPIHIIDGA